MLVIDNSNSMTTEIGTTTRKDLVFESAKTLVGKLLEDNTQLKIGIVSCSTNIDQTKEGTIEDASLESSLSNNVATLNTAGYKKEQTVTSNFGSLLINKYNLIYTNAK